MSSYEQTVEFSLPDNPGASLTFLPQDSILINAAGEIVPRTARTATTDDETGAGSIDLPVPDDTGRRVWRWTVFLPDEETGQFELGHHTGTAQLSVLLTLGMTPQPASPGSLAALIAAYSLPQSQVDWLDGLYTAVAGADDGLLLETADGDLALVNAPETGVPEPTSDGLWARLRASGVGSWLAAGGAWLASFWGAANEAAARAAIGAEDAGAAAAAQAAAIQRTNHTGTQLAATISDFGMAVQAQASQWTRRKPPAGWTGYAPPFVIENNGSAFRVRPDFDLRAHANIAVAKEYYVDTVNGNDAAAGTRNAPLATWNAAAAKADVDRIVLLDGSYCYRTLTTTVPNRSVEIVGEGTVYITSDHRNICTDWVLESGNVYKTTLSGGNYVARVADEYALNSYGHPSRYSSVASVVACQALPGSFYWVAGGTLYVHPIDGRALAGNPVDDDLIILDSSAAYIAKDEKTYYYKNVNFRGGVSFVNASATGGLRVYLEDCASDVFSLTVAGVSEFIMKSCAMLNPTGDGVNYDAQNGINTNYAEIDCIVGDGGVSSTNQASTAHNACVGVRINGLYRNTTGQNVADVSGCKSWLLGCVASTSAIGIGYNCSTTSGNMWLDGCSSDNATYDIEVGAGCTVLHTADFDGDSFGGAGTRGTYTA